MEGVAGRPDLCHLFWKKVEGSANISAVTHATESVMGRLGRDSSGANSDCENISLCTAYSYKSLKTRSQCFQKSFYWTGDLAYGRGLGHHICHVISLAKFSHQKHCLKLSRTKCSFLHISFDLPMLHYSWATHWPAVQHCAAMLASCEEKDFQDISTTKTLSGMWLEEKWLLLQQWWWGSGGGKVVEAVDCTLCCGKKYRDLFLRMKFLCMLQWNIGGVEV